MEYWIQYNQIENKNTNIYKIYYHILKYIMNNYNNIILLLNSDSQLIVNNIINYVNENYGNEVNKSVELFGTAGNTSKKSKVETITNAAAIVPFPDRGQCPPVVVDLNTDGLINTLRNLFTAAIHHSFPTSGNNILI
jgi:hypothetical protein